MLVDYHVHAMGHADYQHVLEQVIPFLETARRAGISEVGFADHDYYEDQFDFQILKKAGEGIGGVEVRLGIEVDFIPHNIAAIRQLISRYPLDFVIGSVHVVDDFVFDMPQNIGQYDHWDIDELYRRYYEILALAAREQSFDFIGHLDVIKVFNYRPKGSALTLAEPALKAIKDSGLCIEINTNGLYKPAGEFYPAEDILKRCFDLSIPITLSSDAHAPENVGRDVARAARMAREAGYRSVATFIQRKRIMQPLE